MTGEDCYNTDGGTAPRKKNKRHHLMDEQALNYEVRKIISSSPTMKLLKDIQRAVVIHRGTSAPL